MPTPEETKERTELAFDTAADNFDNSALGFWDYFGRKTVDKLGVDPDEVITENRWHSLRSPEDWWTIVMGTGHRGTIKRLSLPERTAVREANLAFIRDHGIDRLPTNALYAVATKKE